MEYASSDESAHEEAPSSSNQKKSKSYTQQQQNTHLTKLNVLFLPSEHLPKNIEFDDTSVIVKFSNFDISAPIVNLSNIEKDLTPCPKADSSKVSRCEHNYVTEERQVRKGDEITTVISVCTKCNYKKIQ